MSRIDLRLDPADFRISAVALSKAAAGYPPFDIAYLPKASPLPVIRITLAVAGFDASELDVAIEGSQLVISGTQQEKESGDFLYRGIAGRQFRRIFLLTAGMEVVRARLADGLLAVDIAKHVEDVRKINISVSD